MQAFRRSFHHLKLCDPAEGADTRRRCPPVDVLPVFSPLQEVLMPPVVGKVVQHPGAICHHTGVGLAHLVGIVRRGDVVRAVHHLPSEIWSLIEPQLPGTAVNLKTNIRGRVIARIILNSTKTGVSWSLCIQTLTFFTARQDLTLSLKAIHCWLSAYSPGLRMYWKPL